MSALPPLARPAADGLRARSGRLALGLVLASSLAACATLERPDPLEPINRKVYAFNDVVDGAVLKPVATAYRDNVPSPVREAASNFFANIKDAWSAVNLLLQGRPVDSLSNLMRFGTNTVFGVLGLFDVATGLGLERFDEDLGQTLGRWGMGPGAYLVWPILGPSTVRDSLGLPIEMQVTPETWVQSVALRNSLTVTRIINTRANLLPATRVLDQIALDKYSFVRDAYLQRRRNQVYDGNPPEVEEPRYDDPEPAAAAGPPSPASAASGAAGPSGAPARP